MKSGFTLIELLVVLTIIGVLAGLTVLTLGGGEARRLQEEAARICTVLKAAEDEATFRNLKIGLTLAPDAYSFMFYDEAKKQWQPLNQGAFRQHKLEKMTLEIPRMRTRDDAPPPVIFYPHGEKTPFAFKLSAERLPTRYKIVSDGISATSCNQDE